MASEEKNIKNSVLGIKKIIGQRPPRAPLVCLGPTKQH